MKSLVLVSAALSAVGLLAACTSDGDPPTSSGPVSAAPSAPGATSGPASGDRPSLAGLDGTLLVAGTDGGTGDVYRVRSGRLERVTRDAGVTTVSAADGTVVVGRRVGADETLARLDAATLTPLGIAGFAPAVSDDGALAWAQVAPATSGPGVTKPGGFVVSVRPSTTGRGRELTRFASSVGTMAWAGDRLVVPVSAGPAARIVAVRGNGVATTVARVADADELVVTAGSDFATVQTSGGAVVVDLRTGRQRPFAAGWRPLCWPDDDHVLAARGGALATVAVTASGRSGAPAVVGSAPSGTSVLAATCD